MNQRATPGAAGVNTGWSLVQAFTNLNVTAKYGLSALMLAIVAGHAEVVRLLADAGTDLSLRGTGASGFATLP